MYLFENQAKFNNDDMIMCELTSKSTQNCLQQFKMKLSSKLITLKKYL